MLLQKKREFLNKCYVILVLALSLLAFLVIEYLWANCNTNSIFVHHEVVKHTNGNR